VDEGAASRGEGLAIFTGKKMKYSATIKATSITAIDIFFFTC
jgi:hypothetical protein